MGGTWSADLPGPDAGVEKQIEAERKRAAIEHIAERATAVAKRLNSFGVATDLQVQRGNNQIQLRFAIMQIDPMVKACELLADHLEEKRGVDGGS